MPPQIADADVYPLLLGVRLTIIHGNQVALPLIFGAFGSVLGTAAMFWTMALLVFSGGVGAVWWGMHKP